jgi:hypothetical protein
LIIVASHSRDDEVFVLSRLTDGSAGDSAYASIDGLAAAALVTPGARR